MDKSLEEKGWEKEYSWEVFIGRERYVLNEEQVTHLKQAGKQGASLVWFDNFAISIPHISSISKSFTYRANRSLPLPSANPTIEESKMAKKRLAEIKSKLK